MSTLGHPIVPARPASQWPVGARLRFRPDAAVSEQHRTLLGTPVLVLSELKLIGPFGADLRCSWRQEVLSLGNGARVGWARPDQLSLPLDGVEPE